jgi:uncharacterized protein (DUF433 family)
MEIPDRGDVLERSTPEFERPLLPGPINELRFSHALDADWSRNFRILKGHSVRAEEWYFQCAFFGLESLRHCVEVDPHRRGGVPVLRGTRFTVAEALAELAESSGVHQVAENFDLDDEVLRDLLNSLSLLLNQPYPK